MELMSNQYSQLSSQISQIPSQISSEISSQFKQFTSLFMQNNQEAALFSEYHTDNISTGISTYSKDKQGKRKLNTIDHQPLITGSPDQSRETQEETQMETYDDDDPDLQEL